MLEPGEGQDRPRDFQDRERGGGGDREPWEPEVWVRDPGPRAGRPGTVQGRRPTGDPDDRRGSSGTRRSTGGSRSGGNGPFTKDRQPAGDNGAARSRRTGGRAADPRAVGAKEAVGPTRTAGAAAAARQERRLAEAAKAYEADRYADVRRLLKPLLLADDPLPEVRELNGLTLYRMGKWAQAIAELQAFVARTGSYDQHPVLADCHRALKRWGAVEELWEEIRHASPSPEVVAEGRIVAAGALADRGDIGAALKLLERAPTNVKRPGLHHLRLWYAQADLYERAGEIPRARELFRTILGHDPGFVDTAERLAALD